MLSDEGMEDIKKQMDAAYHVDFLMKVYCELYNIALGLTDDEVVTKKDIGKRVIALMGVIHEHIGGLYEGGC